MARLGDLLGINSRAADYLRLNFRNARKRADDKLVTKRMLRRGHVPHPRLLGKLKTRKGIDKFDWLKLEGSFVVKPAQGLGGQGVMVVKRKIKDAQKWTLTGGRIIGIDDLKMHASDIAEGRYSRNGIPDVAMIEERVKIHPKFRKLAVGGTPDVRVIVYNHVPVMSMLRIPTEESGGKANLHQGAVGLGIDIATGITTHGVYQDKSIDFFPETNKKVNGIAIPNWNKILLMAVETQMVSKLNYLSVDLLIDEEKGPLVLEINDQPGLSIQIANRTGLKKRLERVEGLKVDSADKGVKIAKALFAGEFANRVKFAGDEKVTVTVFDKVRLKPDMGKRVTVDVKVDTGAYSTSIDETLADKLGLLRPEHVIMKKNFKSALGEQIRQLIAVDFILRGRRVKTVASVTHRTHLDYQMIIGRRDLKGFLIDPLMDHETMVAKE